MLDWLIWWFWTARRCKHEPGPWRLHEGGMGKIQHCEKCGKCTGII